MENLQRQGDIMRPEHRLNSPLKKPPKKKIKLTEYIARRSASRKVQPPDTLPPSATPSAPAPTQDHPSMPQEEALDPTPRHSAADSTETPAPAHPASMSHQKGAAYQQDEAYFEELARVYRLLDLGMEPTVKMPFIKRHDQISHSTVYREIDRGKFPKPNKLGHGSSWNYTEVEAYRLGRLKNEAGSKPATSSRKKAPNGASQASDAVPRQRLLAPCASDSTPMPTLAERAPPDSVQHALPAANSSTS